MIVGSWGELGEFSVIDAHPNRRGESEWMATDNEAQAAAYVIDRLVQRFPERPRTEVEEIVSEEVNALRDGPIRDYVPVLVERAAKDRLRH